MKAQQQDTSICETCINVVYLRNLLLRDIVAFVTQAFSHFLEKFDSIDKLNFSTTMGWFTVCDNPDIGGNARVKKQLRGKGNNGLQPIAFYDPFPNIALS